MAKNGPVSAPVDPGAPSASGPVLITGAQRSYDEEHRARVKRYSFLMAFRIPALIIAVLVYSQTGNWWIPLLIVAASVPLPWMAVLIANDRAPLPDAKFRTYRYGGGSGTALGSTSTRRALDNAEYIDIDADDDDVTAATGRDAPR